MKKFLLTFASVLLTTSISMAQIAGDFRSNATTGNWATAGSWQSFDGSSWVTAGAAPSSADGAITILNGNTISLAASGVTFDQLTINSGGQLTINSTVTSTLANGAGVDLTIAGTLLNSGGTWTVSASATWTVLSGGTYIHNTTSGISTPLAAATLASGSNFIYRGSSTLSTAVSISSRTYSNLAFESSSGTWNVSAFSGTGAWTTDDLTIGSGVNINYGTYTGITSFNGNVTVNGTLGATNGARSFTIGDGKTLSVSSSGLVNMATGQTATVSSGGTASILGGTVASAGSFTLATGASIVTSNATGLDGAITVAGTKTLSTGANYEFQGAGTGTTLPSTVNNLTINRSSGDVTLDGSSATQTVSGALNVSSGNLAAGATTNTVSAGSLTMRNAQINSGVTVNLSGDVAFDSANNGTATIAGNLGLGSATRTFTVADGSAPTDMSVSGQITGSGGLTKAGTGTLALSGANGYSGGTTVSAGTLTAGHNTALGSGAASITGGTLAIADGFIIGNTITVGAGGILSGTGSAAMSGTVNGTGTLAGELTFASGGILAPGNSPGTITNSGTLNFSSGSIYALELAAYSTSLPGTNFDQIVNSGTIAITSGAELMPFFTGATSSPELGNAFWTTDHTWTVVSNSGGTITGVPFSVSNAAWLSYGSFGTAIVANEVTLTWTAAGSPVPEPSTYAALLGATALALALYRRRQQQRA